MEQIADEMDATLFRAAFNPIIAEAHDASHGLYHAVSGDTLVQGKSGLPIFVGVMSFAVKAVIDKAAEDGEIWQMAISTSSTTPISAARICPTCGWCGPISAMGSCSAISPRSGHWHDVGGAVPGNYNPAATDAFQEAFVLPPVQTGARG